MLVFPDGIRFVKPDEIPNSLEKFELLDKIRNARIEQGYVAGEVNENLFTWYAEANVNAPQIWSVFRSLCEELLPSESMFIIAGIDDEPLNNGTYKQTTKILDLCEKFSYYLANDCYIQFGLIAQSKTELTEVFVAPAKHFQIWTSKGESLAKVMEKHDIAEAEKLQFIDQYPRTTTALNYRNELENYEDLINYLLDETEK